MRSRYCLTSSEIVMQCYQANWSIERELEVLKDTRRIACSRQNYCSFETI